MMCKMYASYHKNMPSEQLHYYTPNDDESAIASLKALNCDFQTLTPEFIAAVLQLNGIHLQEIPHLQVHSLANGFNTAITGGGIHRILLDTRLTPHIPHTLILKSIPPFTVQQQTMLTALEEMGEHEFIDILAAYPSNTLSRREILSYKEITPHIDLSTPKFYLGILNQLSEQAWILMEDLAELTNIIELGVGYQKIIIKNVLKQMANFHASYWQNTEQFETATWLGRWWTDRNNDFVAEDVTSYALERCAQLHPEHLTPKRMALLRRALQQRPKTHESFTQQPQTLIHWDFGPHNLQIAHINTTAQPTLFDWELTSIGLPQWDLVQFLLPILGASQASLIEHMIDTYLSFLPREVQAEVDKSEFKRFFDIVVMDHFFRVCGPVLFGGENLEENNNFFREWKQCLEWIEFKFQK
jgi:hypothetical protein